MLTHRVLRHHVARQLTTFCSFGMNCSQVVLDVQGQLAVLKRSCRCAIEGLEAVVESSFGRGAVLPDISQAEAEWYRAVRTNEGRIPAAIDCIGS